MGRLAIRPGLTGLAQIQLPPDTNLESVRKKLALDIVYIGRRSLWLDLRLYVGTALYLVGCSYDTVRRLMNLPQVVAAPPILLRDQRLDPQAPVIPIAVRLGMAPADPKPAPEISSI